MTARRLTRARRIVTGSALLWLVLVPVGQAIRPSYIPPPWRETVWGLSLGLWACLWVTMALWAGAVPLGYMNAAYRFVSRAQRPRAFWVHVAVGAAVGLGLLALAVYHAPRP